LKVGVRGQILRNKWRHQRVLDDKGEGVSRERLHRVGFKKWRTGVSASKMRAAAQGTHSATHEEAEKNPKNEIERFAYVELTGGASIGDAERFRTLHGPI